MHYGMTCVLCEKAEEDLEHFYLSSGYAGAVLARVLARAELQVSISSF